MDPRAPVTSVLLRTSGSTTTAPSDCFLRLVSLMQSELHNHATLHVVTDLSLWAPNGASAAALRIYSDAHEEGLRRRLPAGVQPFAFTVADFTSAWPDVVWPAPGSADFFKIDQYDRAFVSWLLFLRRALRKKGVYNQTRTVAAPTSAAANGRPPPRRTISNLAPYFVHLPSLCLWLRRQPSPPVHVWAIEEDAPFIGSLLTPLVHYAATPTDLITALMPHRSIDARKRHLFENAEFRRAFPSHFVHAWEHVERVSARLLRRVDAVLATGAAAFGEFLAPTVCNGTAWCTCADLRDAGLVQRQGSHFSYSHPVARAQLKRLLGVATSYYLPTNRRTPEVEAWQGRWVHGVQGACDVLAAASCASAARTRARDVDSGGEAAGARAAAAVACALPEKAGEGLWIDELQGMHHNVYGR